MSHRLHRLLVIELVGLVMVFGLSPSELGETPASEVTIIRAAPVQANPYQRLYEEMLYPTVRIETPQGVGSGVVISIEHRAKSIEQIAILTAAHVVGNQSVVEVELPACLTATSLAGRYDSTVITASVVITDTTRDLALLRLKPNTQEIGCQTLVWTARLAPRDYKPYIFTPVWVVGCSLGLNPRPSSGEISVISGSYWEVSAPILPGNSGGGVFDAKTHELIGIAVWVRVYRGQLITTLAGIVPIKSIYEFLDEFYRKDAKNTIGFPLRLCGEDYLSVRWGDTTRRLFRRPAEWELYRRVELKPTLNHAGFRARKEVKRYGQTI